MNQSHERIGLNGIILGGFAVMGIAAVVGAALVYGALWALVGGVIALGVIGIALARIGVGLFSRYTDATLKRDTLRFQHIETVMKMGYLPAGRNVEYKPIPQLPSAEWDVPISITGIVPSTIDNYLEDARNLAALSAQWHRESVVPNPKQLAPHRIAKQSDYFRGQDGFMRWQHAVAYFCIKQLADEDKVGGKSRGTFLRNTTPEEIFKTLPASPLPQQIIGD